MPGPPKLVTLKQDIYFERWIAVLSDYNLFEMQKRVNDKVIAKKPLLRCANL